MWARPDLLGDIATRLADGDVLDWDALESSASDDETRELIQQLRVVATIGRVHALEDFEAGASETLTSGPKVDADLDVPSMWGALQVLAVLGRGRFGTVYRAFDPALDREVALKLLVTTETSSSVESGSLEAHVIHEARLMARIRHPNVVTIFGAQRTDGRTGIWMELVNGRTLEAELTARGPLAPAEIVRIGIELCHALAAVHDAHLVHRDVKAQNVLRETNGRLVLGDFGTGQEIDDDRGGGVAGTPAYLAPEIFERQAASERSDLYSLGILLFHLATGSYPVLGRSLGELRYAHASQRRDSLLALRPDFPTGIASAIERALARDPADRYASAHAMEASLAATLTPAFTSPAVIAIGLVLAVIVSGATASWLGWTRRTDPQRPVAGYVAPRSLGAHQLSNDADLAGPGAPSRDGRFLSFAINGNLAIHDLLTGNRKTLTNNGSPVRFTGEAITSRFSADDRALFYVWYPSGGAPQLRRINVDGTNDRLIWRAPDDVDLTLGHWAGTDDVVPAVLSATNGTTEIVLIPTAGGDAKRTVVNEYRDGASLAPDGQTVAFHARDGKTYSTYVMTGDGQILPLLADGNHNMYPVWTSDGRHVLYLSDRTGAVGLWAQPMDGPRAAGPPVRVEPNFGPSFPMGLTDDGTYVFRRQIGGRDVYVAELDERGMLTGQPARLSSGPGDATGTSAWSSDGTRIAFFRRRDYWRSLVIREVSSGLEREFIDELEGVARPRWEPDDRALLFKGVLRGVEGVHRLDPGSGAMSTVRGLVRQFEIAPNGDMFFTLARRVMLRRRDGREQLLHTAESTVLGLALSAQADRFSYAVTVKDRRCVRTVDMTNPAVAHDVVCVSQPESLQVFAWTPDGQSLLTYRTESKTETNGIWSFDVSSGVGHWIGIAAGELQEFRLSPSGRQLSYDVGTPYQEPWALDNVLSRLKN